MSFMKLKAQLHAQEDKILKTLERLKKYTGSKEEMYFDLIESLFEVRLALVILNWKKRASNGKVT